MVVVGVLMIVLTGCTDQRTIILDSPANVKGNGTTGYIPIWDASRTLGDSSIYQSIAGTFIPTDVYIGGSIIEVLGQNITGNVVPSVTSTFTLGNSSRLWTGIYANRINIGVGASASGNSLLHLKSSGSSASMSFDSGNSTNIFDSTLGFANNGFTKWAISKESSGNQNLEILRFNNSGSFLDKPFVIAGASGAVSLTNNIFMANNRNIFAKSSAGTDGGLIGTSTSNILEIGQSGRWNGLGIYSGGTTYSMYMMSTGNVGIGTTSPSGLLHIKSSSSAYQYVERGTDTASDAAILFKGADATYDWLFGVAGTITSGRDFSIYNRGLNTTNFFIQKSSGNVGIGTTSPTRML